MNKSHRLSYPGVILAILFSCYAITTFASKILSPETIPGSQKVDAEAVIELVNKISELIIIDARIKSDRKQGYIEGSVSLPDITTNCDTLSKILPKKSAQVLFYCNGVKCGRSVKSVKIAQQCGYSNIYWFRGGFEEWQAKGYPYMKK